MNGCLWSERKKIDAALQGCRGSHPNSIALEAQNTTWEDEKSATYAGHLGGHSFSEEGPQWVAYGWSGRTSPHPARQWLDQYFSQASVRRGPGNRAPPPFIWDCQSKDYEI